METGVAMVSQRLSDFTGGLTMNQMRPFIGKDGRSYITEPHGVDANGKVVWKAVPIQPGMAVNAASLRRDEWLYFDRTVQEIYQRPYVGVQDLINMGLTLDFDGYSSTVLGYEDISDIGEASMNMDGETQGQNDKAEYDTKYLPLPIIHKEFSINDRTLQMSRKLGMPLDTTMAEAVSRKINDFRENMLFNGASSFKFGGGTLYGYLDYPSPVSVSFSGGAWDTLATATAVTGDTILADVQNMIQGMLTNRRYGPWTLYCPDAYEKALSSDYKANSDKTIRQRILELSPQLQGVRTTPFITVDKCVMVQMTKDTIRLVRGMPMTTIQWQVRQMGRHNFKVVMIEVPQIRADQDSRSGIAVLA